MKIIKNAKELEAYLGEDAYEGNELIEELNNYDYPVLVEFLGYTSHGALYKIRNKTDMKVMKQFMEMS